MRTLASMENPPPWSPRRGVAVVCLAPAFHVLAQQIHQRQIVALFLDQQRELRQAGAPGFVSVRRRAATHFLAGFSGVRVVDPVSVGFRDQAAQDRFGDRLDGDFRSCRRRSRFFVPIHSPAAKRA